MRYSLSPNVFAHLDETNVVRLDIRQTGTSGKIGPKCLD